MARSPRPQDGARPSLTIGRADQPPVIDGVVDDVVWNSAQPFSNFIQQEPSEGEPASERTEIRFLLDRQNLYVALVCSIPLTMGRMRSCSAPIRSGSSTTGR